MTHIIMDANCYRKEITVTAALAHVPYPDVTQITEPETIIVTVTASPVSESRFMYTLCSVEPEPFSIRATSTMKSSTFYSSSPELPDAEPPVNKSIGNYITATVVTVFALVFIASLISYLKSKGLLWRRRHME
jgi:hypothetical protein